MLSRLIFIGATALLLSSPLPSASGLNPHTSAFVPSAALPRSSPRTPRTFHPATATRMGENEAATSAAGADAVGRRAAVGAGLSLLPLVLGWGDAANAEGEGGKAAKRAAGKGDGGGGEAGYDLFKAKYQVGINRRSQRLYGCTSQANCVSVSASKNPSQFLAPWDYTVAAKDDAAAWRLLKGAVEGDPGLKVVEVDDAALYLRAEGSSKIPKGGVDDVEFLMVPDQKIVTVRSASRENQFVYPYQQPIPDGGYQKARMDEIRKRMGWVELNYAGDGMYSDLSSGPNTRGGQTMTDAEYLQEYGDMPRASKFRLPW